MAGTKQLSDAGTGYKEQYWGLVTNSCISKRHKEALARYNCEGLFHWQKCKFCKFLGPPHLAIMGDMFQERGQHAHNIFFYMWLMKRYRISAQKLQHISEAMLDSIIRNRPKVARMRIIFGSQFNGTHIVLRIVNGCLKRKKTTFSKFLAPPYKAIMGHIFEERSKHVHYLFFIYLLMKMYRISLKEICFVNETNTFSL